MSLCRATKTDTPTGDARGQVPGLPGRWAEDALCAQADPDFWFPSHGQHKLGEKAKRICAACPVRVPCLDYALAGADTWGGFVSGIWGGTTPREREQLRQARKAAAA
jgi:WhiB family redox-sensing transcriptional regulator